MVRPSYRQEASSRGRYKGILQSFMNERGATEVAEYAFTLLIVIGAITAMTTYFRRSIQARIRDARHYMITNVSTACNDKTLTANCMSAAGLNTTRTRIAEQYEPYYARVSSEVTNDTVTHKRLMASAIGTSGNFIGQQAGDMKSATGSQQMPPMNALNDIQ